MIRILIPTDFSASSKVAARYAMMLMEDLPSDLLLVHMVKPFPFWVSGYEQAISNEKNAALRSMEKFRSDIMMYAHRDMQVRMRAVEGENLHETITRVAGEEQTDLVVMGTEGAKWLRKYLFGTHAASVVKHSPCPVLVVPPRARMEKPKHIMYATDLLDIDKELNDLVAFARVLDAWVHVLHVFYSADLLHKFSTNEWLQQARDKHQYMKITFCGAVDENIVNGIEKCLQREKGDMLAVFSHRKSYTERLVDESISLEEVLRTELPLLTFYKEL